MPETHSFLANGVLSHNTTVALHAVASAQAAGGIAAFIDAEHALDPDYAKKLGVDTDALLVSQPDMESIESLNTGLEKFPGTLVFVSHDREFVSSLATRVFEVKGDGSIIDYLGGYEDYLASLGVN